ncbi:MAG: AraC family transcriptional regulator [Lentisphaeria bacterium]|nr:AraC family transcriptional regulator [Lentisphaeria bacterium]
MTKIIARPGFTCLPEWGLPLYARSAGHYRLPAEYRETEHARENFVQLFWGVAGLGEILIDGAPLRLGPGDAVWKGSRQTHGYRSLSPEWELRWITFDGRLADEIIESYGYPHRIAGAGPCPAGLFLDIESGLQRMTPHELRRLAAVLLAILAQAGRGGAEERESDRICERCIGLIREGFRESGLNVNTLAARMRMHRTTLNRHFRSRMHCSPGEYLKQFRLQRAVTLLKAGELTVAEIAAEVGIPDQSQFSRTVRQAFGRTPKELRATDALP